MSGAMIFILGWDMTVQNDFVMIHKSCDHQKLR